MVALAKDRHGPAAAMLAGGALAMYVLYFAVTRVDGLLLHSLFTPGPVLGVTLLFLRELFRGSMDVGLYSLCLDAARDRPVRPWELFGGFRRAGAVLAQNAVAALGLATAGILHHSASILNGGDGLTAVLPGLIPVGVAAWAALSLGRLELARDPDVGGIEALGRALGVVRGRPLTTLAVLLIGGVCTLLFFPLAGFASLMTTVLYLALRTEGDGPTTA